MSLPMAEYNDLSFFVTILVLFNSFVELYWHFYLILITFYIIHVSKMYNR